ncbi:MAG: alpha/beta fold hydrolase [Acidimicrobiales bacterium]
MGSNQADGPRHGLADVGDGIRIHYVEQGSGPLVVLVHGFPESWYSYRHQLAPLATAGYRAVAIDVRGYGRSSKPAAVDAYRMSCLAGDVLGVVRALGESSAVVVGHDWGAPIAWNAAQHRPDVFRALATLSVPFAVRGPVRPSTAWAAMVPPGEEFYVGYFQQPGRAEAELHDDTRGWLRGFYCSASGDAPPPSAEGTIATIPTGRRMRERFWDPGEADLPAWLTVADLEFFAGEFERTGLTGGLNRYRNVDRDWEDAALRGDVPLAVPYLFVGGDRDGPTIWGAPAIAAFGTTAPQLWRSVVLSGVGHWTQQERPGAVNEFLLSFLAALDG